MRIRLTAHPLNAPQASRSGGRRTLRDHMDPARDAGTGRACPIITGEEHNVTLGSLL